jgi:hypothetical protein
MRVCVTTFSVYSHKDEKSLSAPHGSTPTLPTSREASFLFILRPEELQPEEQEMLTRLRQLHQEVDLAYKLVQQFARMLRTRTGEKLNAWLTRG